jgi:hypothetical protein
MEILMRKSFLEIVGLSRTFVLPLSLPRVHTQWGMEKKN